ncbi:hypothetical protein WJX75_003253 [Coccomyxa subellipsoidea]|uniref:C2 Aida-type domain-containing protein n=1 Tax=Coccomyxa subellipsoidea TaxID=248742 RepID=A0ABR2YD21_9CHLO
MPVKAAGGQETSKEEAESSGVLSVWRGRPELETASTPLDAPVLSSTDLTQMQGKADAPSTVALPTLLSAESHLPGPAGLRKASSPDQELPREGTIAAARQAGASSAVTGGDVALPAVTPAALGESAAWSVGPLEQHPAHAQPQLPPQQPLGQFNTGNPFARGLSRPCSPVNAFGAHTRSRSMPSFLFDDPRPASAQPFAASPTAAAAAAQVTNALDQAAPNQATGASAAWLYQTQPSPGVWLEGTRARPVNVILSEVLGMPQVGAAAEEPNQAWRQRQPPALKAAGSAAGTQGQAPEQASADKDSCHRAFHAKGHAKLGGVSLEDAELVHRELGTAEPFEKVWALADWDASERLSEPQFLLFMFLLKALKKGRPLPPRLGLRQVSYLLGIPAEELLPPSHSLPAASSPAVPRLLPWPESVPQTPELPPHPATAVEGLQASAAANRPAGNAQAQSRQPSDLILRLAAEAKAAQMQARNQAPATPEGVSLKQPLQAGAEGVQGRSPPLPLGSPSFWQPFGAGRESDKPTATASNLRPATASTSAEARERARNGASSRAEAHGRPPSGQQRGRNQTADLLSTWPQRAGLREGIPSPRRASPAAPGSGATTPRSLSPDSHPLSHHPSGHVSLYKQPTLRTSSSTGGIRRLAITVERANLDYRKPLDRPVFCISLHDADGRPLETPQDTPPGHFDRGRRCVSAGHTVILRTPMRQMPPEAVVYVELKHWKSASRKMSVLGWSFAPIETLVDASSPPDDPGPRAGQLFLHLWRKPLDLTAHQRRIQLKALHPNEHDLFLTIASA